MQVVTASLDEARFRALFAAHHAAVVRYARRRDGAESAQDVASEAFLVAWRRIGEVPAEPLPWMYGVARKVLANEHRAAHRFARLAERAALAAAADAEALDASVASLAWFATAYAKLSPDDRK